MPTGADVPDWVKSLLTVAFGSLFAFHAVRAVRTGRLKPSLYDRVYLRSTHPGTFWFHVAVDVVLACALFAAAVAWA